MTAFIEHHRDRFGVGPICRVLDFNPFTYWAACSRPPSTRRVRDESLKPEIERVHADNHRVYGVRKVWKQLNREGVPVARCSVARLMRELHLRGVRRGKPIRTTKPDAGSPRPPDLVERDFAAGCPNQLWVADLERHEALSNRAVMKGHRLRPVAAGRRSWGQPGWRGRASPVASSPDNAGTSQYRQMTLGPASKTGRCT